MKGLLAEILYCLELPRIAYLIMLNCHVLKSQDIKNTTTYGRPKCK